jgi:hypothetical protein
VVPPAATVDGVDLRARYVTAFERGSGRSSPIWDLTTIPFGWVGQGTADQQMALPPPSHPDYPRLLAVLGRLDEHVDVVADVGTAESVHQLVGGNPARAGAALELAASGAVPDEFDVTRTPISGHDIHHRVLLVLDPWAGPAWAGTVESPAALAVESPAALADPAAAALVTQIVPDPATAHLSVSRRIGDADEDQDQIELTADELELDALGWVRASGDPGELLQRIARAARRYWAADPRAGKVLVKQDPAVPAGITLAALLAAASSARELLAASRALTPRDLAPEVEPPPADPHAVEQELTAAKMVAGELAGRAAAAATKVGEILDALAQAAGTARQAKKAADQLDDRSTAEDREAAMAGVAAALPPLVDALFDIASAAGEASATPVLDEPIAGADQVAELGVLLAQAQVASASIRARLAASFADPAEPLGEDSTPEAVLRRARQRAQDRVEAVCRLRLPLLTAVTVPGGVAAQMTEPSALSGAEPHAVRGWLYDQAQVSPATATLLAAYDLSEALGTSALRVVPAHLPAPDAAPTRWAGADPAPAAGTTNLVIQLAYTDQEPPAQAPGLAVDAWKQTVTDPLRTTGVAFHFDEPDSTPPQAVLVAVPPDLSPGRESDRWGLGTLLDLLTGTLALARDRAVPSESASPRGLTIRDST